MLKQQQNARLLAFEAFNTYHFLARIVIIHFSPISGTYTEA